MTRPLGTTGSIPKRGLNTEARNGHRLLAALPRANKSKWAKRSKGTRQMKDDAKEAGE